VVKTRFWEHGTHKVAYCWIQTEKFKKKCQKWMKFLLLVDFNQQQSWSYQVSVAAPVIEIYGPPHHNESTFNCWNLISPITKSPLYSTMSLVYQQHFIYCGANSRPQQVWIWSHLTFFEPINVSISIWSLKIPAPHPLYQGGCGGLRVNPNAWLTSFHLHTALCRASKH
jgi:hypothetical protein